MQTIFCTECGSKVVYSGAKPKFCSSCGSPIGGGQSKASTVTTKRQTPSIREQMESKRNQTPLAEDETDIDFVPNISSLDYEVSNGGAGNPVYKFEDIVHVEQEEQQTKKTTRKPRKSSRKSK
jgi:DNA-directed RNA polymerase subunit RPC12/RpoP